MDEEWDNKLKELHRSDLVRYDEKDEYAPPGEVGPPGIIAFTKEGKIVNWLENPVFDKSYDMWEVNERTREFIKFDTIKKKSTIRLKKFSDVLKYYNKKGGRRIKRKVTKKKTKRSRKSRVKRA
jgi:hypothetical protein